MDIHARENELAKNESYLAEKYIDVPSSVDGLSEFLSGFVDEYGTAVKDLRDEAKKRTEATHYIDYLPEYARDMGEQTICDKEVIRLSGTLISKQGDNPYGAKETSGLVSVANLLNMSGIPTSEADIAKIALSEGLCSQGLDTYSEKGETSAEQQIRLLAVYGIEAEIIQFSQINSNAESDKLAELISKGHGAIFNISAETASEKYGPNTNPYGSSIIIESLDKPPKVFLPNESANRGQPDDTKEHAVCVTGTVTSERAPLTRPIRNLAGYYVCDSTTENNMRFINYKAIRNAESGCVVITKNPIRQPFII